MSNESKTFIGGIAIGMGLLAIILMVFPSNCRKYNDAINECERDLPRDKSCIITAIPEEE